MLEGPVAAAKPDLRFPGNVGDDLGLSVLAQADAGGDLGREPIVPGRLDEGAPAGVVAGLGDGSDVPAGARGVLRGSDADKGHELVRMLEAAEVADFTGKRDGVDE